MMKRLLCLFLAAVMLLSFFGCKRDKESIDAETSLDSDTAQSADTEYGTKTLSTDVEKYEDASAVAVTDFAVRLLRNTYEDGENTLVSPLSILAVLALTAEGASDETLSQIENVMRMPAGKVTEWFGSYINELPTGEDCKLTLANSLWLNDRDDFELNGDFAETAKTAYKAEYTKLLFDDEAVKRMNSWVSEATDGRIENIVGELSPETVLCIINAVLFDAEWDEPYSDFQINNNSFITEKYGQVSTKMMSSSEELYLENENSTGFIKYYKDKKYAFAALLPNRGCKMSEYLDTLDGEALWEMLDGAREVKVHALTPMFKTENEIDMIDPLKMMGMTNAFDANRAELSGLGVSEGGNLMIGKMIHKACIDVDAKGTVASAVTVVSVLDTALPSENSEEVKRVELVRPFVYMIIDCEKNIPIFIGTMMDPGVT